MVSKTNLKSVFRTWIVIGFHMIVSINWNLIHPFLWFYLMRELGLVVRCLFYHPMSLRKY